MLQRFVLILLSFALVFGAAACKKNTVDPAKVAAAKLKAQQKEQALKSYRELVKKYPDSPYAEKAKERIRALAPPATPAKK
jgi:outer membrane protein assembly factor BamD (BamD/ComL family)